LSANGLDADLAARLFLSGDVAAEDAVWQGGARRTELEQVAGDASRSPLERLLAAEVLWRCDAPRASFGEIYARALVISSADLPANLWGFLYYDDDDGPLGARLLATGDAAVPELIRLLDDPAPMAYEGSRDAMLGNSFHYRVKDAAGYFLAKIRGVDITFHTDQEARDSELERLRADHA
jgi:hypothetical protein